jgi:hypothetical protein
MTTVAINTRPNSTMRRLVLWYSCRNRKRKATRIRQWMQEQGCETVLFVGDTGSVRDDPNMANTGIVERALEVTFDVVMGINLYPVEADHPTSIADARDMPFPDRYADCALANAIIEHVGDEADQRRMIDEMTRVARCWVITTPNRWYPVEAHTSAVFSHWSPSWRARQRKFTRLLSRREFKAMLPAGAVIEGRPWSPTFSAYYAG